MKKQLLISGVLTAFVVTGAFIAGSIVHPSAKADAPQTSSACPAGSYEIDITKDGQPICKLDPTGCPYGDSIPLGPECDKHAADQANNPPVVTPATPNTPSTTPTAGCYQ